MMTAASLTQAAALPLPSASSQAPSVPAAQPLLLPLVVLLAIKVYRLPRRLGLLGLLLAPARVGHLLLGKLGEAHGGQRVAGPEDARGKARAVVGSARGGRRGPQR